MEVVFWLSLGFVFYVYAGYPVLLEMWARMAQTRGRSATPFERRRSPRGVSVIIAARNEAAQLPDRIENLLASDYPCDRLQIIVASDGSTDDTAAALAPWAGRVDLLMLPPGGKACALNAAVEHARYPVLVFADARQRFAPDAIRRLERHFADPAIGAVSGELVLDCEAPAGAGVSVSSARGATPQAGARAADGAGGEARPAAATVAAADGESTMADGIGAYWRYEKWLRRREAAVGSTLGVTGAIYAMRRSLWTPLPAGTLLDDVLGPMRLVLAGYRVTFDDTARAWDRASADAPQELRRKVRTLAGNYQLVTHEPRLLVPVVNPVWLQFMSHKIGRLLVPYALLLILVASAALAPASAFYAAALGGQLAFYALAVYGGILDRRARLTPARADEVYREAA